MKAPMIDANIILRFLLADHPDQSPRCRELFRSVEAGEAQVYMAEVAFCDVVWTLKSYYKWSNNAIYHFAMSLLAMDSFMMTRKSTMLLALSLLVEHNIDFSDSLMAAEMLETGSHQVFSYDRDFERVRQIERIEP